MSITTADSNIDIPPGCDRARLSAARLERFLNWMGLAETPRPTQRFSAEQLSELLVHMGHANEGVEQTPT